MRFTTIILTIVLNIAFIDVQAQNTIKYDSVKGSPKASISDVNWLTGHWRGEAFGGQIDEVWSPPVSKSMMFAFQAEKDGEVTFYEFGTITEEKNTLILRLKHFHPDLKGWEEKDDRLEWKLVRVEDSRVYFNNFTFERIGTEKLNVYVLFKNGEKVFEQKFSYSKIDI